MEKLTKQTGVRLLNLDEASEYIHNLVQTIARLDDMETTPQHAIAHANTMLDEILETCETVDEFIEACREYELPPTFISFIEKFCRIYFTPPARKLHGIIPRPLIFLNEIGDVLVIDYV